MAERKGRELGKVVGTAIGSHWIGTQSNERQREAEREREFLPRVHAVARALSNPEGQQGWQPAKS